jgi:5-formyltetrahydrofolate cyclo-ligase
MDTGVLELREALRKEHLSRRKGFRETEREKIGSRILEKILDFPEYQKARRIALYADMRGEVPTGGILRAATQGGKAVFYPRVVPPGALRFFRVYLSSELREGTFLIPEPVFPFEERTPEEFDLIFIPGVVFDLQGTRLGYGRGFYDRALAPAASRKSKAGLAFGFQIVPRIPLPPDDRGVAMDWLITEERIGRIN